MRHELFSTASFYKLLAVQVSKDSSIWKLLCQKTEIFSNRSVLETINNQKPYYVSARLDEIINEFIGITENRSRKQPNALDTTLENSKNNYTTISEKFYLHFRLASKLKVLTPINE